MTVVRDDHNLAPKSYCTVVGCRLPVNATRTRVRAHVQDTGHVVRTVVKRVSIYRPEEK